MNLIGTEKFVFFTEKMSPPESIVYWHKTSEPRDAFRTAGNAGYFFMSEPLDGANRGMYITVTTSPRFGSRLIVKGLKVLENPLLSLHKRILFL